MGVLGVSEGAQHNALLRGHAATLVARSEAVAAPHDRGADRAYSAENVPRIRTAEALRARRHRGRHASACPGKGILGGVRAVAPHPTRCRLHARLAHKQRPRRSPCKGGFRKAACRLLGAARPVRRRRSQPLQRRPQQTWSRCSQMTLCNTLTRERKPPCGRAYCCLGRIGAVARARTRGSQLARAIRRWQHPSPRAATRRTGVLLGRALYGSHWYGRNFPSNVMRTRGPASLSPRSSARWKLIALMMPSPKSSWMSALSAGP